MKVKEIINALHSKILNGFELKEDKDSYGNSSIWVKIQDKKDIENIAKVIKEFYGKDYDSKDVRSSIICAISVKVVEPIFESQTLTYMKLLKCPKGIVINFFTDKITNSAIHLVNEIFKKLPS